MTGWPFWAATSDDRIDRAFDLAGLAPGEHLIDLGCGDGRVLLRAAALRSARVTGVELDAELATSARSLLAEHGVTGTVIEADFASIDLTGVDVVFAYLSPSTLQRLRARLAALPVGSRVVTTGYAVPGWEPDEVGGRCFLYRLPATETPPTSGPAGWTGAGLVVAMRPDGPSLVAVPLRHSGGDVVVDCVDPSSTVTVRTGADRAGPGDDVVVDLRFEPRPPGWTGRAQLHTPGAAAFEVFLIVDEGPPGMWNVGLDGCRQVAEAIDNGRAAAVLSAARATAPG